jgi:uncharacterized protein (DUF4213/DUF364 family)
MKIIDALLESLPEDVPVRSILVGAHWTVVCSLHCGMAATMTSNHPHGHAQVREAGRLHEKTARELADYARSTDLLEASIGLAAINSLLQVDESLAVEINASDVLAERGQGKYVALVGHFPFIPQLRAAARQLWVIEQHPTDEEYPPEAAIELLPQADVIAITGSTLVNHTLDGLLALCPSKATVMVLGPSTPLASILFDYGVNILSGSYVVDEAAVQRTVGQGASFQQVEGKRLLTFVREKGNE